MNFRFWIESFLKRNQTAAGILLLSKSTGKFLVAFRSKNVSDPNTWEGFGGKAESNDLEREAKRELEEETLYRGKIDLISSHVYDNGVYKYHNYIGIVPNEFKPHLSHEHVKAKWITFEELMALPHKQRGFREFVNNACIQIQKLRKL